MLRRLKTENSEIEVLLSGENEKRNKVFKSVGSGVTATEGKKKYGKKILMLSVL